MANSTTSSGTKLAGAAASDPDMCRITGYLKDLQGNALTGWRIIIRHIHEPLVVSSDTLVLKEYNAIIADDDGLVSFDLMQGATARLELAGRVLDLVREITVPEETSADLVDVLFPYIVSVDFDDGASATVESGETLTLEVTATLSNGAEIEVTTAALEMTSADEDVLAPSSGNVFIGGDAGTTTVSIDSIDTDELELYQEADGDVIGRLDVPEITLPSDITVTVT